MRPETAVRFKRAVDRRKLFSFIFSNGQHLNILIFEFQKLICFLKKFSFLIFVYMRLFKLKFQSSPKYNLLEITSLEAAIECVSFRLFSPFHGLYQGRNELFSLAFI